MADDDKKGPVKPPIIDAKPSAKSATSPTAKPRAGTPSSKPASAKPPKSSPSKPASPSPTASSNVKREKKSSSALGTIIIATLLGATLGAGTIGFMAFNNLSPFEKPTLSSDFTNVVEQLQKRVFDLENIPATDTAGFAQKNDLDGLINASQLADVTAAQTIFIDQLRALEVSVGELNIVAPAATDSGELEILKAELAALKSSIIELSPNNSAALENQLLQNERFETAIAQIASLAREQTAHADAISGLNAEAETITSSLAALSAKAEAEPATVLQAATATLPLILSAWDNALRSGAPFANYLASAAEILPDLQLSEEMRTAATAGVSTSNALKLDFAQHIPLFVRDNAQLPANAAWYDKLAAQAKSAIGLRPLDQSGNDPLALVARIEAALEESDLSAAKTAFEQLPDNMRALATGFAQKLNATFSAHQLMFDAQQMALDMATSPQGTNQ